MKKELIEVKGERIISLNDAKKEKVNGSGYVMNGNYLGYIDGDGFFDFLTYNGNNINVCNTQHWN